MNLRLSRLLLRGFQCFESQQRGPVRGVRLVGAGGRHLLVYRGVRKWQTRKRAPPKRMHGHLTPRMRSRMRVHMGFLEPPPAVSTCRRGSAPSSYVTVRWLCVSQCVCIPMSVVMRPVYGDSPSTHLQDVVPLALHARDALWLWCQDAQTSISDGKSLPIPFQRLQTHLQDAVQELLPALRAGLQHRLLLGVARWEALAAVA